jgi:tetratricopeptide (TPR) repeat protein
LISIAASGWTIWEQKFHSGALGAAWSQTWPERIVISGFNVWFYLAKLAWPHPLIFIYPRWVVDASRAVAYLPAATVAAGLAFIWWYRNGRLRPVFFAAAYFVVSLFPVLGFFNVYFFRYSFVGDHFQYLASMGPLALAAAGMIRARDFFGGKAIYVERIAAAALLFAFGVLTWQQCKFYSSSELLWRETLDKNPSSWMAQNNLATILLATGRTGEAVARLRDNLRIHPNNVETHNNLGNALMRMGRMEEAFSHLQKALELEPDNVTTNTNLANALLQMGRAEESFSHLQKALKFDPNYTSAHFNMANTLLQMGRVDEALSHLKQVLVLDPNDAEAQKNMAWVLATSPDRSRRDGTKAVELAERALRAERLNPLMGATLAAAYAETGRFPEALRTANEALQLAIDSANAPLANVLRAHLELYRANRPVRDVR